jgi:uncharacterized protein
VPSIPKWTGEPEPLVKLGTLLQNLPQVVVMLSGGMDSGFLLWACTRFLNKDRIKAVTFYSPTTPRRELDRAVQTAKYLQVEHIILNTPEMEDELFKRNDLRRCYYCKRSRIAYLLDNLEEPSAVVLDGSHLDDLEEYRPGMKALKEFNIISPLLMAGLDRSIIASLCQIYGLPIAECSPESCLATRIKTGQQLDAELLVQLDKLEDAIYSLGISLVRARYNNGEIRLEVKREEMPIITEKKDSITETAYNMGFDTIALDLHGYGQKISDNRETIS